MEENGRLVQFLYNEDREVVAEKDYSGNLIRYIRGLGLISSDSENAKTYYHYVCDEQGSVSHIIRGEDKESGVSEQGREQDRILNQYEYDAFGNTISCKEQVENRFRYQGEQYDPITRQYYLRARYYNPVIGRFIQEDTYYGDGLNLYEYCRNNTITYKDPTGHNICPTQRDLYHKYKEEGMSPQEAYQKMRKELGLDSKSGYKDSGVGNGKDPWRSYESGSKADVLAQNRVNGRAFEQQEFAKFSSQNSKAVEQITVKTPSGVRTRVDAIGLDTNGNVVINEYKSSLTAPLTDNQKIAFPEISESGATVVGKGKGIFTGGYQIPPGTKVTIIRPE